MEHLIEKELEEEMNLPTSVHQLALSCAESLAVNAEGMDANLKKIPELFAPSDLVEGANFAWGLLEFILYFEGFEVFEMTDKPM